MHGNRRADDATTKGFPNCLVTKADAKDGDGRGKEAHKLNGNSRLPRRTGAR